MTRKFSVIAPGVMFPPVGFATRKFALPEVGRASTSKPPCPVARDSVRVAREAPGDHAAGCSSGYSNPRFQCMCSGDGLVSGGRGQDHARGVDAEVGPASVDGVWSDD